MHIVKVSSAEFDTLFCKLTVRPLVHQLQMEG